MTRHGPPTRLPYAWSHPADACEIIAAMDKTLAAVALLAIVWLIDGYIMWRRRAIRLAEHVQTGDLEAARNSIAGWVDRH